MYIPRFGKLCKIVYREEMIPYYIKEKCLLEWKTYIWSLLCKKNKTQRVSSSLRLLDKDRTDTLYCLRLEFIMRWELIKKNPHKKKKWWTFFPHIGTEYRVSWLNKRNMKKKKKVIGAFFIILSVIAYLGWLTHSAEEAKGCGRTWGIFIP